MRKDNIRNSMALLRGNLVCFLKKIRYKRHFQYNVFLRFFKSVEIRLRNSGSIFFEKNVKIDSYALIASNGGKIVFGNQVGIGRSNVIVSMREISIGDGTILAPNVLIYDHDHLFDSETGVHIREYNCAPIAIGKNCWIGANTVILKGTVLGDNCVVGAGSVVKGVYPPGSKIIQKRTTKYIEELNNENDCSH